jgi:M6 family metalloprotease-like protein
MSKVIGRPQMLQVLVVVAFSLVVATTGWCDEGRLLQPKRLVFDSTTTPNLVHRKCLTPEGNDERLVPTGSERWRLPSQALAADFDTTIHCLVLRYNFQYETTDNANTTGRGLMDLSRPLDTLTDSEYVARLGHEVDPPPHDSLYFNAHLRALNRYWETVSGGRIHLAWDIYPACDTCVYQLPHPMGYYGKCDFIDVIGGLENYFVDCIKMADTLNPEIDFSQYQAFFLFHAGSDAQNDLGFPTTCQDLYSGFIKFADTVWVDNHTHMVRQALMMPETAVQDGRVTALNAVLAHEFGHQLGLVDLYNTEYFFTQIGDFSLMDNNGFGTGIEFPGWPIGKVFGVLPVFPDAWSRAFLGIEDVVDFRSDTTGVDLLAAELTTEPGLKVARLPITENEYYLVENRLDEVNGTTTMILADKQTSVFQWPVDSTKAFTGEYDYLMPGSGVLIYHVDEEVARLDYDGDGTSNFADNDLQWARDERKFLSLVEADGVVHFGGYYYAGYGDQGDFFRDDQAHAFTPHTNPQTIDNSGNETHFYVENISRKEIDGGHDPQHATFDFSVDRKVSGFPIRAGYPRLPLAPIVDDLDGNGTPEIIMAAGPYLSVVTSTGENFIRTVGDCPACPLVYDTVSTSVNPGTSINPAATQPVPVYDVVPFIITAGPVTGRLTSAASDTTRLVAVSYPHSTIPGTGWVTLYAPRDLNDNARADKYDSIAAVGWPIAMTFGDSILYALTAAGWVHRWAVAADSVITTVLPERDLYSGICKLGNNLVVLACDTLANDVGNTTWIYYLTRTGSDSYMSVFYDTLPGLYVWGPVAVDMNLDGNYEIAAFTAGGGAILVTIDQSGEEPSFSVLSQRETDHLILTPPSAGDIDLDGYPEIVVGGRNEILAFNADLIYKTDYPLEVDDRFPDADMVAAPLIADIAATSSPEVVLPSDRGNFYSFGRTLSYGFPLSSGEQQQYVSGTQAVLFHDETGGKLGWLGGDGWFYAWEVDADTVSNFWPMSGGNPAGTFALAADKLPETAPASTAFDDSRYYNYPNPVRGDQTTIRYYLGDDARSVVLNIFDLSGRKIAKLDGQTRGGTDNEVIWDCGDVTPGVYRCVIEVEFAGSSETAFTDIAVIR